MKNLLVALFLLAGSLQGSARTTADSIPQHLQNLPFPDFKLLLTDGVTNFYTENLSPNMKTVLMYFSPECDHCKNQTIELLRHIDQLSDVQIVMTTVLPFEKLKQFYDEMKLAQYKNIIVGRDPLFFFPKYFRNQFLPGIAVYNKHRTLVNFYDGGVKTEELIQLLHK